MYCRDTRRSGDFPCSQNDGAAMADVEERLSEVFSRLLTTALASSNRGSIVERSNSTESQQEQKPAKDPRYNDKSASVVTKMECMLIAAHGEEHDPETKAVPKEIMDTNEAITRTESLDIPHEGVAEISDFQVVRHLLTKDKLKQLKYEFEEQNGEQRPRQFYLDKIVELFQNCQEPGALIWYTGYGERHTGNWCFKDGTIRFEDIINLYQTFFHGKVLYLVCDCAHAGQWVMAYTKFLEGNRIPACGHKVKEKGYLLKIYTSCQPEQWARDFCFSTGAVNLSSDNCLGFFHCKQIAPTQTTFGTDFTKLLCFQDIDKKCQLENITHRWTWVDYAKKQRSAAIEDLVFLVRGKDRGKAAWHYVLVNEGLKEEFRTKIATGNIDVAKYGYVVCSGWGENPPDDIKTKVSVFTRD